MNHKLAYTLALIILGWLVLVATPVEAVTAAGPYYVPPSWDQQLQCDTTATCPRFIVLTNWGSAAVLDRETGLVWESSPSATGFNWVDAQTHCINLTAGSHKGWRLPTLQELATLVDSSVPIPGPALAAGHPFHIAQSPNYWSATTYADVTSVAWYVYFGVGDAHVLSTAKGGGLFVWCVRGGHGVNPE